MIEKPRAKPPREFADWLLIAVASACALPVAVALLDLVQQPLRDRWTYCFADSTPPQALAQLRLAKRAYARGDMVAAKALAKRGQDMLETAADRRNFGLPYYDQVPPEPETMARVQINVLGRAVRAYQYQCYPLPPLTYFGSGDGELKLSPEQQPLPWPTEPPRNPAIH